MKKNIAFTLLVMTTCMGNVFAEDCQMPLQKSNSPRTETLSKELTKANVCKTVKGLSAKSLKTVWLALLDTKSTGGKRFETPPPAGTPTGKVFIVDDKVKFDLNAVSQDGLVNLTVKVEDSGQIVKLPSYLAGRPLWIDNIKPGTSYSWVLVTKKETYRGSFEIPEADELQTIKTKLAELDQQDLSADVKLIYQAAIFDEAECYFNRELILDGLRNPKKP
ncbi:hypothetical protein QN372_20140 [Undibacterium sp. RTI2.1]|uniref:hypothetical protein n=1 Tax=unclassified Undibacterium TaxID=2630295 RepID=UPI002AB513CA|nr:MULTISPECIES: hypothetical protein [unclassified Undibacterium]MDY7537879.1 hypothetical protein [Undibacterium sp. 5I1]MEB0033059.1 hypothetical protein [Undibacterium sp. RTI2.1]MEB0118594.1 hypothetical protein [Undibacterium sp. RTI2.2]MEB0230359.1 hypothetical protein [Undibacterium sp. 10I3]MEB0259750.1 hypothetical protein [Undibacterium sp. 5I1]